MGLGGGLGPAQQRCFPGQCNSRSRAIGNGAGHLVRLPSLSAAQEVRGCEVIVDTFTALRHWKALKSNPDIRKRRWTCWQQALAVKHLETGDPNLSIAGKSFSAHSGGVFT